MQAIQQMQTKITPQQLAIPTAPITQSAPMDIFQRLIIDLDTEGRYLFLNAVANQLRYPNNHTHYFSCVLLYLFAEANMVCLIPRKLLGQLQLVVFVSFGGSLANLFLISVQMPDFN